MIAKTPEEKADALIIEIRSGEYTPLYAKKLATMFHDQAEAYSKRVPAVVPRETQTVPTDDVDAILTRFFITGGRQYRYNENDRTDLRKILTEHLGGR